MNYEPLIDRIFAHFTSKEFAEEVFMAKRDFFDRKVLDDDGPEFEQHLEQFLDWYVFSRPLEKQGKPPIQMALLVPMLAKSDDERFMLSNLGQVKHSLYEFQKVRSNSVFIKDIFSGQKIELRDSVVNVGFTKDECFEARLIPHEDNFIFTKAFCFHPAEARRYIRGEMKKIKKSGEGAKEELLLKLAKMKFKLVQYKHLQVEHVYTNEQKVKI